MGRFRAGAVSGVVVLVGLLLGALAPPAAAQPPSDPPRPQKSVYGKLTNIDKSRNRVVMKTDTGQNLEWRLDAPVIAEASRFKPGDRMIVIYRQTAPNEKRVTAVAFPGSASTPIYVNMTGSRVVVRSTAAAADGTCDQPQTGPVSDYTIPSGGLAEVLEGCWCCGEGCSPGSKSGLGRALLVQCFK